MVALGLVTATVPAVIVEKNIGAPAWLAVEPSKPLHQSYQQLDTIADLASDGRRGGVYEGIEAVTAAVVVESAEVVRLLEVEKLPDAVGLVGVMTLGGMEGLMLEAALEVDQMGIRGPLREVKEVVLGGIGCDWALGPTVFEELRNNAGKVEDIAVSGKSGHSDAVKSRDQSNRDVLLPRKF